MTAYRAARACIRSLRDVEIPSSGLYHDVTSTAGRACCHLIHPRFAWTGAKSLIVLGHRQRGLLSPA
jgi:hypothetical protein